jgi:hypothetical protein
MKEKFITKDGVQIEGYLVRQYTAFEGGIRYIFQVGCGEHRCIKDADGNYRELVV